jgi:hypothetical protein
MEKELNEYINWICKAEESILNAQNTSELYKRHIIESIQSYDNFLRFQKNFKLHILIARQNYLDQITNDKLKGTKKKKIENNDLEEELNFDIGLIISTYLCS